MSGWVLLSNFWGIHVEVKHHPALSFSSKRKCPLHPLSTSGAPCCLVASAQAAMLSGATPCTNPSNQRHSLSSTHLFCYLKIARSAYDGWLWSSVTAQDRALVQLPLRGQDNAYLIFVIIFGPAWLSIVFQGLKMNFIESCQGLSKL